MEHLHTFGDRPCCIGFLRNRVENKQTSSGVNCTHATRLQSKVISLGRYYPDRHTDYHEGTAIAKGVSLLVT